ncbi:pseudouridine synthase [Syncephalastrum racemosum]|uniref:Pseudouridine synthase n=1 Tax=Syncephalastrum racemosum TaxID=13706 RepID=A0A1X2HIX6_SYNRA|nr:pseudouridine synthase [Syncephalastrum racemosum]
MESSESSEQKDVKVEAGVKRDQPTGKKKEPKENKRAKSAKERREHQKKNQSWGADDSDRVSTAVPGEARLPKKKVALLFGYNGANYQGLQLNPAAETIEKVVFEALCKANAIPKMNADDPQKVSWMRAARTDKGVHAAGNILSLKINIPNEETLIDDINSILPEQIRVWGYVVVQRSFNCRTACDSRVYEYLLPSAAFMPPTNKEATKEAQNPTDVKLQCGDEIRYAPRSTDEELKEKDNYRIDKDTLEKFREAMGMYVGTHNFHNYTIGRGFRDKSCYRFLKSIKVEDPIYIGGTEWLSVKLHGQSFMLHQIRKMISMALLTTRLRCPLSLIERSFEEKRINIPKAPAVGLLLDHPVFGSYNKNIKSGKGGSGPDRDPIDFDKYKDTIEAFREKWIYTKIFESEKTERWFDLFLTSVDAHFGPDFKYFNAEGVIPDEAVITTKHTQPSEEEKAAAEE